MPLFFILGRPRSGTTLLRVLFDAHPNVIIPPEFPIVPLVANKFRRIHQWDRKRILSFLESIYENHTFGHRSIGHLRIDREALTRNLLGCPPETTLGELFIRFNAHSQSLFPKEEIQYVGDKNPLYSIFIRHLLQIFPEAKFICLIRDYRDTFCSLKHMNGEPFEAPIPSLQVSRWRYVVKQFFRYAQKYPDRFTIIRYEDLVTQPEYTLRGISTFLNIPYDPSVFSYYLHKDKIIETCTEENIRRFHKSLLYPINTSRMNLWTTLMTTEEVSLADQIAGKYADLAGYARRSKDFSLRLYLRSRPMAIYGYLLFKFLASGINRPYWFRKTMAARLKYLVRFYLALPGGKTTH